VRRWPAVVLLAAVLGACGDETPTDVGGGLLPPGGVETFEVILGPDRFLVTDTSFGVYSAVPDAEFAVVANQWDDALDSRILARWPLPTVTARDTATGAIRVDSFPVYFAGRIVLRVDTLLSSPPPVRFAVHRTTEEWHGLTATWALRIDSAGVREPWSVPGGSPGMLLDTVTWEAGTDSVVLHVDSATMALWRAAEDPGRGALITVHHEGVRLRTSIPVLEADARPSFRPDTVVTVTLFPAARTFIFQPMAPDSAAEPRVGGTPSWRTFLRLRDRLDTVTVACPGVPGCRVALSQLTINRAALQLQPVPTQQGLAPETPLNLTAHIALPTATVPLHRLPVTEAVGGTTTGIPTSSFMEPGAPLVEVALTDLIISTARPPDEGEAFRPTWIALLSAGARTLGHGTFAEGPSLRLTLSFARNLQLP
jgi:hypothetical protein